MLKGKKYVYYFNYSKLQKLDVSNKFTTYD